MGVEYYQPACSCLCLPAPRPLTSVIFAFGTDATYFNFIKLQPTAQPVQSKTGKVKFSYEGYLHRFDKVRLIIILCFGEETVIKKINEHTSPQSAVCQTEKGKIDAR